MLLPLLRLLPPVPAEAEATPHLYWSLTKHYLPLPAKHCGSCSLPVRSLQASRKHLQLQGHLTLESWLQGGRTAERKGSEAGSIGLEPTRVVAGRTPESQAEYPTGQARRFPTNGEASSLRSTDVIGVLCRLM